MDTHDPTHASAADQNVERLLQLAYAPEKPRPEFARRLTQRLVTTAADSARARRPRSGWINQRRLACAVAAGIFAMVTFGLQSALPPTLRPTTPQAKAPTPKPEPAAPAVAEHLTPSPKRAAPKPDDLPINQSVQTAAGQRRRLALPDGSILYLNENTAVTLTGERRVKLTRGELYVEVAPRESAPFTVQTPGREVAALGTRFAVQAEPAGTGVLVTQGKVKVSGLDEVVLTGQQLQPGSTEVESAPRATHLLGWMEDLVTAAGTPVLPANPRAGGALVVTDSFGQESQLSLRKYGVDVHIEDGFARTTIDQTYFNHENRRLEGTFHFPLPPDASLSRLAMYVDGNLMEGGMVEREAARAIYESIVRKMQDPALLEWVDGSTFKMRVFPLEARQEKRIVLSYTQKLPGLYGHAGYRFPSGHSLEEVRDWSFHAVVKGGAKLGWNCPTHDLKATAKGKDLVLDASANKVKVDRDIVLEFHEETSTDERKESTRFVSAGLDGTRYLMLRYRPKLPGEAKKQRRDWVILFETSADRDPVLARTQVEIVRGLLTNAEHDDTFAIITANATAHALTEKPQEATPANIDAALAQLDQAHLVGALDLKQGLLAAAHLLESAKSPHLVHIGSGLPALGERRNEELAKLVGTGTRYIGVAVGKRWNRALMKSAAERSGGYFTQINPDEKVSWRAFDLLATLNTPRLLDVKVTDKAGSISFLTQQATLAQGEELIAAGCTGTDTDALPEVVVVCGTLDGKPFKRELPVKDVAEKADYLPRTWAKLEIDRLLAEDATKHKDRIVALSKAMYVMTPYTSLLVLENEKMYQDHKVDRGRKDHWAMYPCPPKIPVVYEPIGTPAQTPAITSGPKTSEEVLGSIILRVLNLPGENELSGRQAAPGGELQVFSFWQGFYDQMADDTTRTPLSLLQSSGGKPTTTTQGRTNYAPYFVSPTMQWAGSTTPAGSSSGPASSPGGFPGPGTWTGNGGFPSGPGGPMNPNAPFGGPFVPGGPGGPIGMPVSGGGSAMPPGGGYYPFGFGGGSGGPGYPGGMMGMSGGGRGFGGPPPGMPGLGEKTHGYQQSGLDAATHYANGWALFPRDVNGGVRDVRAGFRQTTPYHLYSQSEAAKQWNRNELFASFDDWREADRRKSGIDSRLGLLTDKELPWLEGLDGYELAFSPDGRALARGGDRYIRLWSQPGALPVRGIPGDALDAWLLRLANGGRPAALYQRPVFRGDARLWTDLLGHAPGLNTSRADVLATVETEVSETQTASGRVDEAAAARIERARKIGWRSITLPLADGKSSVKVAFDGAGRYAWERTLPLGLQEVVVCDGKTLLHLYPELGLGARRTVSRFHRADLMALVPWVLPPVTDLSRGADLRAVGEDTVAVVPAGKTAATHHLHLVFAPDGRLSERRLIEAANGKVIVRETYSEAGVVKVLDAAGKELGSRDLSARAADAPDLKPQTRELVLLEMPLRSRQHILASNSANEQTLHLLKTESLVSLLASDAATGNPTVAPVAVQRLLEPGSRAGLWTLLLSSGAAPETLPLPDSVKRTPVGRYVQWLAQPQRREWSKLLSLEDGLLRQLAMFAAFMQDWTADSSAVSGAEVQRLTQFVRESRSPAMTWAVVDVVCRSSKRVVTLPGGLPGLKRRILDEANRSLAGVPGLEYAARHERATLLLQMGENAEAARQFGELYTRAVEAGELPALDTAFKQALAKSDVPWMERMRSLKDRLLERHNLAGALALAWQCWDLGDRDLADEIAEAVEAKKPAGAVRVPFGLSLVEYYHQTRRLDRADRLLQDVLGGEGAAAGRLGGGGPELAERPLAWRLGVRLAAERKQSLRMASCLDRALELESRQASVVDLQQVRQDYTVLLGAYEQQATALATLQQSVPADFVGRVVRAADRWRSLDSDGTTACQAAWRILKSVGRHELAWEYLSTTLVGKAGEPASVLELARALHRDGDREVAELAYRAASDASPADTGIVQERATNLEQAGRLDDARKVRESPKR